jgi:hypothetical protein
LRPYVVQTWSRYAPNCEQTKPPNSTVLVGISVMRNQERLLFIDSHLARVCLISKRVHICQFKEYRQINQLITHTISFLRSHILSLPPAHTISLPPTHTISLPLSHTISLSHTHNISLPYTLKHTHALSLEGSGAIWAESAVRPRDMGFGIPLPGSRIPTFLLHRGIPQVAIRLIRPTVGP